MKPITSVVIELSPSQRNGLNPSSVHFGFSKSQLFQSPRKLTSGTINKSGFASLFTIFTLLFNTFVNFFNGISLIPTTPKTTTSTGAYSTTRTSPTLTYTNTTFASSSTTSITDSPSNGIYIPNCSYFNCDECGITYTTPNLKIVGGVAALPHSWPAQVLLRITYDHNVYINETNSYYHVVQSYSCGGTLINRDTVLGAAHCVITQVQFYGSNGQMFTVDVPLDPTMYKIYVGYHNIQTNDGYGIERDARNVIPHPEFDPDTNLNDLALFRLSTMVELNEAVQVACLPDPGNPNYPNSWGESVYAAGWGTTGESGPTSSVLNNVAMTLYAPEICANVLSDMTKNWDSQLCAGEVAGGKDTCQGDSGGGIYDKNNGKFIAVGVVSYGDGCAEKDKPGLYTKISYYIDWINQTFFDTI